MARNLYVTVAELQTELDAVNTSWSAAESAQLGTLIEAVSRAIDAYCGRHFYQSSAARYFTAESVSELVIPDLVSIDSNGLVTDTDGDRTYETVWATTDYDLEPFNASEFDEPYTYIGLTPQGTYSFPTVTKGVKITGVWGWPAIPRAIRAACSLETKRALSHSNSPSGVAASEALGTFIVEPAWHPKSIALMRPYRRTFLVAAS